MLLSIKHAIVAEYQSNKFVDSTFGIQHKKANGGYNIIESLTNSN